MEKDILRMQIRLFRAACIKWNKSNTECAEIFDKYDIDGYISDMYEIFHVQGDDANLSDIETYLENKGALDAISQAKGNPTVILTEKSKEFAMVLLCAMTIEDIARETGRDTQDVLKEFRRSRTFSILFDPDTGLWMNGPDYIRAEYEENKEN